MTDTFEIGAAVCNCPEQEICYHIGALALHSGYKTPIFSYHDTNDENDLSECTPKPLQEVYVKCEELDLPSSKVRLFMQRRIGDFSLIFIWLTYASYN